MEVTVSRRALFLMTVLALVTVGLGAFWFMSRARVNPAQEAARAGILAFYTMNIEKPQDWDRWAAQVCEVSTQKGCQIVSRLFAPALARKYGTGFAIAPRIETLELAEDRGDRQIWKAQVRFEGDVEVLEELGGEVYVEVAREEGTWKFQRVLFKQEVQKLQEESP